MSTGLCCVVYCLLALAACSPQEPAPPVGSEDSGAGEVPGPGDGGTGWEDGGLPPPGGADGGLVDAGLPGGGEVDAGAADAGGADAGLPGADGGVPDAGPAGCPPLRLERGVDVGGFLSDRYTWQDRGCRPRSAALVRNDVRDPKGWYGGYLCRYTYEVSGATRTCEGASDSHPGWGYTVNHFDGTSRSSREQPGTYRTLLAGRHHALHEYRWRVDMGGRPVQVTVHWLFATGRDHPVWAVTFDTSQLAPNALRADSRSPYGDLLYDGNARAEVSGVGWGDRYRFTSLHSPLTPRSGWDYTQPNLVPYVLSWTSSPDAEMGSVQTQTWRQRDAGAGPLYGRWGQRAASGPMPTDWQWTYQLNQYELPYTTRSHRLAWGTPYGSVGNTQYTAYGNDRMLSGHPYLSYSVFAVLGLHSTRAVLTQVEQVEAYQQARLTATVGEVLTQGPAGVGRSDTAAYEPVGYNPLYATWEARAEGHRAMLLFSPGSRPVDSPMFVLRGYTALVPPARVWLDGVELRPDVDYFASVDEPGQALWLTLPRSLASPVELRVE